MTPKRYSPILCPFLSGKFLLEVNGVFPFFPGVWQKLRRTPNGSNLSIPLVQFGKGPEMVQNNVMIDVEFYAVSIFLRGRS